MSGQIGAHPVDARAQFLLPQIRQIFRTVATQIHAVGKELAQSVVAGVFLRSAGDTQTNNEQKCNT